MKIFKRTSLTFFLLIIFTIQSFATWSIIVVDPKTKQIGIAGASCTQSVYGIGAIVPGKGAIVVQAMSNYFARVKGFEMIIAEATPSEILNAMMAPQYSPEMQQYAIVTVKYLDSPATYTGSLTFAYKGALTAKGVSVQGNILADSAELKLVMNTVLKAQQDNLSIEDVLMLGLEAGAKLGGDKRCGDTKALSAFITVANPGDDRKNPYLNLVVYGLPEKVNAIEALRQKFNDWKTNRVNDPFQIKQNN
jgi:uncharacterized Ntn-hydrolase superfamily protein